MCCKQASRSCTVRVGWSCGSGARRRRRRRQQWPQKVEAIECGGGLVKIEETQQVKQATSKHSHTHIHTCISTLISSVFVPCAHCLFASFACTYIHS